MVDENLEESKVSLLRPFEKSGRKSALFWSFMIGVSLLLPWNAAISAGSVFLERYPDHYPLFYISTVYCFFLLLAQVVIVWINKFISITAKLYWGLLWLPLSIVLIVLCIALMPGSTFGFGLILITFAIMGIVDGVAQNTILELTALMPKEYATAVVLGEAVAGVITSLLRIGFLYFLAEDGESVINLTYALVTFIVTMATFFGGKSYMNSDLVQFYIRPIRGSSHLSHGETLDSYTSVSKDSSCGEELDLPTGAKLLRTFLFLNGFMTLFFFPAVAFLPASDNALITTAEFTAIGGLAFSTFDSLGREAAKYTSMGWKGIIFTTVFGRMIFLPLFILTAMYYQTSVFFGSLILIFGNMCLFGFTQGFTISVSFRVGPTYVGQKLKAKVGRQLGQAILAGLAAGSLASTILMEILE